MDIEKTKHKLKTEIYNTYKTSLSDVQESSKVMIRDVAQVALPGFKFSLENNPMP